MTFQEIYEQIMKDCHHDPDSETVLVERVKKWINRDYQKIWADLLGRDPTFGRATSTIWTTDDYATGTVTVTADSTTVTGSDTVWTSAMAGRKFTLDSWAEVYTIATFVSATEITIDHAIPSDYAGSSLGYTIYEDEYSLPSDCGEISCLKLGANYATLMKIGLREMRSKQSESPFGDSEVTYNDPIYYALKDDRSTIILYPAPTRVVRIDTDYTKELTELSADSDTPVLPVECHELLVIGGKVRLFKYDDNYQAAAAEKTEYEDVKATLIRKNAWKTDFPRIKAYVNRT